MIPATACRYRSRTSVWQAISRPCSGYVSFRYFHPVALSWRDGRPSSWHLRRLLKCRRSAASSSMATIERLRRSSRESIALVKQVVDEGLDEAKKKWEAVVSGRDSSHDSGTSAEAEEQKHELFASGVAFPAVHPARSLPLPEAWPNRPLLLRRSAVAHGCDSGDGCSELGVPFPVETELFEGHALLRTRSTPGCEEYFAGKARRTSFVVSGRFKRPLSFAQLYTGQVAPTLTALVGPRTHTLTRSLYL